MYQEAKQWNINPELLVHYTGKFWIYWKDLNSRFLGCNIYMAKFLNLAHPKEIAGLIDHDFGVPKDEVEHFIQCDQEVIQSGETKQFLDSYTYQDEKLYLTALKSPLIIKGETKGIYGMSYINNIQKTALYDSTTSTQNIFNFTNREVDVMKFVVKGKTAKEIAKQLFISVRTVEKHIENAKIKTNCKTRSALFELLFPYFYF